MSFAAMPWISTEELNALFSGVFILVGCFASMEFKPLAEVGTREASGWHLLRQPAFGDFVNTRWETILKEMQVLAGVTAL
ncbi:MAG: hypothetical protein JO313_02060 [Verrucomicrobia bacterium]|nr:hypothetical protein [Verrucomicrobiota bacterium]MBV9645326.1 hypothetical protein [Verrucomicrobiota bacterium]